MTSTLRKLFNKAPVAYVPRADTIGSRFAGGVRSDMTLQLEQAGLVPTLFAIVDRKANAFSQVEWHLYRKQTDARRTTPRLDAPPRQEITSHSALTVWDQPNPFMTGMYYREASAQHFALVGEFTSVIVRAPGLDIPMEIWPVRPDRMHPVPHPTDFISGWIYTGPNGEKVPLDVRDVIQVKRPHPLDAYRGFGAVQALMTQLDSARASAEWNRNFFRNSAEPGGVVEFDDEMDDTEFKVFQDRWRQSHQGISNAHRVAILENGAKWKPVTYSQRDMQFVELNKLSREQIREGFAIHGHMLGLSEDVNRANADAGEVSFSRWHVKPDASRWKDMLNHTYLPLFKAPTVEFDHGTVVPEDREADDRERTSKANAIAALVGSGAFEPDSVVEAVGWPEMAVIPIEQRQPPKPTTSPGASGTSPQPAA